jgi:hypothetical protein
MSAFGNIVTAISCCHGHHGQRPHRAAPKRVLPVHVYAGTDPVTGKPRCLKQTCPDEAAAMAALGRLLAQAGGNRFPNREATLGQALGKYLEVADLEVSTGRHTRATSAARSARCWVR